MTNTPKSVSRFPRFHQLWKPVAVTGAGGTALAVWLEEILVFSQEILGLISLSILAGVIYLLDILMFKSTLPKKEK